MDLSGIVPTDVEWWQVVAALLIVVAGWIIGRLAKRGTASLLHRAAGISEAVIVFAARLAQYLVLLLAIGTALAILGANVQPLLAVVAILAIVAALVLRGVADNFAAGVLIQARHPVQLGDEVQFEGPDGELWTAIVKDLNSRSVILLTYDGLTVHVPNAKLIADPLVNSSAHGVRRSEVQVRIERGEAAVDDLTARIAGAAASVPGVIAEPAARALVVEVSEHRVIARVQFWHAPLDGVVVTAASVRAIAAALEADGRAATVTSQRPLPPLVPSDGV